MSHETILIVTTTFMIPTTKFPQGLLKDHSRKKGTISKCVCMCLMKNAMGDGRK